MSNYLSGIQKILTSKIHGGFQAKDYRHRVYKIPKCKDYFHFKDNKTDLEELSNLHKVTEEAAKWYTL
jgi:hypothetical protein